jgi:hypothetical protein
VLAEGEVMAVVVVGVEEEMVNVGLVVPEQEVRAEIPA